MKKNKKCAFGGSLGSDLQQLAPLASLIPGFGSIAGPALGLIGGLFGDKKTKDPRNPLTASPGNYYLGGPVLPQMTAESTSVAPRPYMGLAQTPNSSVINNLDQLIQLNRGQANQFLQAYNPANLPIVQARQPRMTDRYMEKANGGVVGLSNEAYKVNGDPSVTDSVSTSFKGMNLKLDNNEVIDTASNFVYSDKLKDPQTNSTFAAMAAVMEQKKGKAQKAVTKYGDTHAENTIKHTTTALNSLAKKQELLSLIQGKRAPSQGMAYGGPTDPPNPWLPFLYQNQQPGMSGAMQGQNPNWTYSMLDQMPNYPATTNPIPATQTLPEVTITGSRTPSRTRRALHSPISSTVAQPKSFVPGLPNDTQGPLNYGDLTSGNDFGMTIDRAVSAENNRIAPFLQNDPNGVAGASNTPQYSSTESMQSSYTNSPKVDRNFTIGDALQVGSLVNSFARLRGGPEKEKANYDNSRITRNVYDVNTALQSNAANYSNTSNNIDTSSVNLRRALQNQMLASKTRADNSALTQYDQMNQGARTDYENRVSNQQRYNVGQTNYTNDINARNRAGYDSAVQNAFGNLSNFGIGLNQRKQNFDALDLYGSTYKDVYSRILKTLGQNG